MSQDEVVRTITRSVNCSECGTRHSWQHLQYITGDGKFCPGCAHRRGLTTKSQLENDRYDDREAFAKAMSEKTEKPQEEKKDARLQVWKEFATAIVIGSGSHNTAEYVANLADDLVEEYFKRSNKG